MSILIVKNTKLEWLPKHTYHTSYNTVREQRF